MNRFIKFFTGKTSTGEELELMKWAKASDENEKELLRSLHWFQTVDLLSDEASEEKKHVRFPVWMKYVIASLAAATLSMPTQEILGDQGRAPHRMQGYFPGATGTARRA